MKRSHLIEAGLVITGLIFGYKFLEGFISLLAQMYVFQEYGNGNFSEFVPVLLVEALYFLALALLIRNARPLAAYLTRSQPDERLPLRINLRTALQLVIIGIAIAQVLSTIAPVLLYLFDRFRYAIRHNSVDLLLSGDERNQFALQAIRLVLAMLTLVFYREISGWFVRRKEADELTLESEENKN